MVAGPAGECGVKAAGELPQVIKLKGCSGIASGPLGKVGPDNLIVEMSPNILSGLLK